MNATNRSSQDEKFELYPSVPTGSLPSDASWCRDWRKITFVALAFVHYKIHTSNEDIPSLSEQAEQGFPTLYEILP